MEESSFRMIPIGALSGEIRDLFDAENADLVCFQKNLYCLKGGYCIITEDRPENRRAMDTLRENVVSSSLNRNDDLFRRLLERKTGQGAEIKIADLQIPFLQHRNVLVFTAQGRGEQPFTDLLRTAAPMNRGDLLIPMKYNTAAFIRSNHSPESDEAEEYARAVLETLEVEEGFSAVCGIGECKDSWQTLPDSYEEGLMALETASQYHLAGNVFRYKSLFLERMLGAIPADRRKSLREEFFRKDPDLIRNEEMLETIRSFFENDLNLSTTARRMFVHRNTLTYRLEKIRKSTGMDLKHFTDACVFYILLHLPEDTARDEI